MDDVVKDRRPIEELIPVERVGLYRNEVMKPPATRAIGRDLAAISSEANLMRLFERLATDPTIPLDRIETLMTMQRELRAETAQNAFMAAMAEAQSEMRVVIADKSNSQTHSKYASYAALDAAVRPIFTKYGFCVTFDTDDCGKPDQIRIIADCSNAGFTRRYHLDMPCDGKGAKGGDVMTKTHAVMSATSYGKRGLLILIFNIPVADKWDDDGNAASRKGTSAPDLDPSVQFYVTQCVEKIAAFENVEDLKSWIESESSTREKLGITKGKPGSKEIMTAFLARGKALSAGKVIAHDHD